MKRDKKEKEEISGPWRDISEKVFLLYVELGLSKKKKKLI